MILMKMLKNKKNVEDLISAVSKCKGDVMLCSMDAKEQYNLKSQLSQIVGIARLCEEHGDEYEVFCMNRLDEGPMLEFFRNLRKDDPISAA